MRPSSLLGGVRNLADVQPERVRGERSCLQPESVSIYTNQLYERAPLLLSVWKGIIMIMTILFYTRPDGRRPKRETTGVVQPMATVPHPPGHTTRVQGKEKPNQIQIYSK